MKKSKLVLGILSVMVILFSYGCKDNDNELYQKGHLVINLTDAPFPYDMIDAATVHFIKAEIRKVTEGNEDGYPFIPLELELTDPVNLLELRDGVTSRLIEADIDPGMYDLIRLYVDEASLTVKDGGGDYSVKVPSGAQTGIKIFMQPALKVAGGLTSNVLLDFNVEHSFVLKGNMDTPAGIKGFNFKPVIKAVNMTTEGTLDGVVTDADADTLLPAVSVWIEQDASEKASALTNGEGYYIMDNLAPGFYDVIASLEGFYNDTVEGVEIVEGNLTTQNLELKAITGTLEGVVKDVDADTLLPGASVWIEKDQVEIASVTTDGAGHYSIPDIPVGFYDVIAALEKFDNDTVKNLEIVEGDPIIQDFGLTLSEE